MLYCTFCFLTVSWGSTLPDFWFWHASDKLSLSLSMYTFLFLLQTPVSKIAASYVIPALGGGFSDALTHAHTFLSHDDHQTFCFILVSLVLCVSTQMPSRSIYSDVTLPYTNSCLNLKALTCTIFQLPLIGYNDAAPDVHAPGRRTAPEILRI